MEDRLSLPMGYPLWPHRWLALGGMMTDGMSCTGGLIACSVASTDSSRLADVGADVGIGMDFCRFGCSSASVKALRFAWASATVGWGASALVGCGA